MDIIDVAFPYLPGNRANFDIQSQDLPIIYVPGFLGSEILCDQVPVWMPARPAAALPQDADADDGMTNATCATARPAGKMVDSFLRRRRLRPRRRVAGGMNAPGGYKSFGWDWRKRPQESLAKLDALVDELLDNDLAEQAGHRAASRWSATPTARC